MQMRWRQQMPGARRRTALVLAGLLVLSTLVAASPPSSRPELKLPGNGHFLHDLGGLLSEPARREVEERLSGYEAATGHRIFFLTLREVPGGQNGLPALWAEADKAWRLSSDRMHAAVLVVYSGYDFISINTDFGAKIPPSEAELEKVIAVMRHTMERRMSHDPAVKAGVEALIAAIEGRPFGMPMRAGAPAGTASGWVIDDAEMLGADTLERLNSRLHEHEKQTSNQVVVVTVASLQGKPIEEASLTQAKELKIGQRDKDNGVLLFIARDDRKVRIEVGYGLEAALTDARCSRILRREIIPAFREGSFDRGVEAGVEAILASIEGTYAPDVQERLGLAWLPVPEPLPLQTQVVSGFFFWVLGPLLCWLPFRSLSGLRQYVAAGAVFAAPAAYVCFIYPGVLLSLLALTAIGAIVWMERRAGSRGAAGSGRAWSTGGSGSSRSSYSEASSGGGSGSSRSSFSGGGGSFGGGGASAGW